MALIHAAVFLAEALMLSAVALYAKRARAAARAASRSAHEARQEERLAAMHAGYAEGAARRAEAAAPPDVIPFPESAVRGGPLPEPVVLRIAPCGDGDQDVYCHSE